MMAPASAALGPEGPPAFIAAAGVAEGLAFTVKAVNTAVGGNDFTTADMVGDLVNIIGSQLVPGVGPAGVLELIDAGIDQMDSQQKEDEK